MGGIAEPAMAQPQDAVDALQDSRADEGQAHSRHSRPVLRVAGCAPFDSPHISRVADSRIQEAVEDIHGQVHENVDKRRE